MQNNWCEYKFFLPIVFLCLFILKNIIVLLSLNNGFDLIDEGSHLLFYHHPEQYPLTFHNYQYFVSILPDSFIQIKYLRLIWWLLSNSGFLFLSFGIYTYFKGYIENSTLNKLVFILFLSSSTFLSVHDRMLGYNCINQFLLYTSFGIFLYYLKYNKSIFLIISSILITPILPVKISTFFIISLIYITLILVHKRDNFIKPILSYTGAVLIGLASIYFFILPSNEGWVENYLTGLNLAKLSGYGSFQMIMFLLVFEFVFIALIISFSIVIPILIVKKLKNFSALSMGKKLLVKYILSLVLLILSFRMFSSNDYYVEQFSIVDSQFYYPILILVHLLAFLTYTLIFQYNSINIFIEKIKINLILLALFIIPFSIFIGSFSSIPESLYAYNLPILILIILVPSVYLKHKVKLLKRILYSFMLLCSIFMFILFIQVAVAYPARLLYPINKQTEEVCKHDPIRVDHETALFIESLASKTQQINNDVPFTYLGNYAGTIYLLNKVQLGTTLYLSFPYYPEIDQMNVDFNQYFFEIYKDELKNSVLLIDNGLNPKDLHDSGRGILDFNYHVKKDSVYNPYLKRESVENSLINSPYTYIYLPKGMELN